MSCRWGSLADRVPIQKKMIKDIRRTRDGWANPLAGGLSGIPSAIAENVEAAVSHVRIPSHRHPHHSDDHVDEVPELMEHRIADHSVNEHVVGPDGSHNATEMDADGLHGGPPSPRETLLPHGSSTHPYLPDQPSTRNLKQVSFRLAEDQGTGTGTQHSHQPMLGSVGEERDPAHHVHHAPAAAVAAEPAVEFHMPAAATAGTLSHAAPDLSAHLLVMSTAGAGPADVPAANVDLPAAPGESTPSPGGQADRREMPRGSQVSYAADDAISHSPAEVGHHRPPSQQE